MSRHSVPLVPILPSHGGASDVDITQPSCTHDIKACREATVTFASVSTTYPRHQAGSYETVSPSNRKDVIGLDDAEDHPKKYSGRDYGTSIYNNSDAVTADAGQPMGLADSSGDASATAPPGIDRRSTPGPQQEAPRLTDDEIRARMLALYGYGPYYEGLASVDYTPRTRR